MKLGLLTAPFPQTPLMDVADWAAAHDFEMLEVCVWPQESGASRRYGGVCHVDVEDLSDARAKEIVDELAGKGLGVSGLGYYPNPLHPDAEHRAAVKEHLMKVISGASKMGVPVVNTFIGADGSKTQKENWEHAKKVWPEIVEHARDSGVRIAIENCPMIFSYDEWPSGHNVAHTPSIWRDDVRGVWRNRRAQLRPVPPRLADDRPRAGGRGIRASLLSLPRQGLDGRSQGSL